ncbi:MAG: hypothetical protein ABIK15_14945 [Pseudomonadota bacterium]
MRVITVIDLLTAIGKKGLIFLDDIDPIGNNLSLNSMHDGITKEIREKSLFENIDLQVVSGKISNPKNQVSKYFDCMIVEGEGKKSPLTNGSIYDIHNVIAVIELTKKLCPNEIDNSFTHLKSLIELYTSYKTENFSGSHNDYKSKMLTNAFRNISRREVPTPDELKKPDLNQSVYYSILADSAFPLRIVWSCFGNKTEYDLRQDYLDFLSGSNIDLNKLLYSFPNLIICGSKAIVKYTGMPYGLRCLPKKTWTFLVTHPNKAIYCFLNILWYRICYKYNMRFESFTDGKLEHINEFLEIKYRGTREDSQSVCSFEEVFSHKEKLDKPLTDIDWEPEYLLIEQFAIISYLCEGGRLSISDKEIFIKGLEKRATDLYSIFKSSFNNIKIQNIPPLKPDFNSYMESIFSTGLVFLKNEEIRLLTNKCIAVATPNGFVAGDSSDGRFQNWLAKLGKIPTVNSSGAKESLLHEMNEIFDREMKALGGRFQLSHNFPQYQMYKDIADNLIRTVIEIPTTKKMIPVQFDWICNPKINAVAFIKKYHFIGVTEGALLILIDIFSRMFAHPEILPQIGNSKVESLPPLLNKIPSDVRELNENGAYKLYLPIDPVRRSYSKILINIAFNFLIAHEMAHLRNGHVDLIRSLSSYSIIEEISGKTPNNISSLTYQTLEMDADCSAVSISLSYAVSFQKEKKLNSLIPNVKDVLGIALNCAFGSPHNLLYTFGFALNVLFRLFGEDYWDMDKISEYSHTPAPCRRVGVSATITEILKKKTLGLTPEQWEDISQYVFIDAEKSIDLITQNEQVGGGIFNTIHPKANEQSERILTHWKETVRDLLIPFNNGGELAL